MEKENNLKSKSYAFALDIIRFIDIIEKKDVSTREISKQLVRSATSIGANITEAHGGATKKDFANFFSYALKSSNETKFWLCLLRDSRKVNKNEVDELLLRVEELGRMLGASILTLRGKS